ncbi:ion channel [Solirubrobacter taibaiensis]|nr:ion channel [Solirubrobacter taibaiensis]
MTLEAELNRDQRSEARRRYRKTRKRLVAPDRDSRPPWTRRGLIYVLRLFTRGNAASAHKIELWAKGVVETVFSFAAAITLVVAVAFVVADAAWASEPDRGIIGQSPLGSWFALIVFAVLLAILIVELLTYRPRVYVSCSVTPSVFFTELAKLAPSLAESVERIRKSPSANLKDMKECEQDLVLECHGYLLLEALRIRILGGLAYRMLTIFAAVALVGYALSGSTNDVIEGHGTTTGDLVSHLYFSVTTFFTIGFGDIGTHHSAAGYAYLTVIVLTVLAVAYFVIAELVSSHGAFRADLRAAAATFVALCSE